MALPPGLLLLGVRIVDGLDGLALQDAVEHDEQGVGGEALAETTDAGDGGIVDRAAVN